MHFGLTEEQLLLQETVCGFAAGECPAPRLREIFDAGTGHDPALWKGLAEMGIAGLTVPEPLGGAGLGLLELALVMEELGVAALPGPSFGHALACLAIQLAGSDAQRQRWLPDLASGERIATVAFAEPGGAWDPESWSLAADGDHISGAKRHVPHASLADLVVVGLRGGRFAVVERGATGQRIEDERGVDRTRPIAAIATTRWFSVNCLSRAMCIAGASPSGTLNCTANVSFSIVSSSSAGRRIHWPSSLRALGW